MRVHLEQGEVSALLERQAFAPSRWRRVLFWLQITLLVLSSGYGVHLYHQQSSSHPAPLIRWQQGSSQVVNDPALSRCLFAWGQTRRLPPAIQLIISTTPDTWYLVWISAGESFNFSIKGPLQELCR